MVAGCDDEVDGRAFDELVQARDAAVIAVRRAVAALRQTHPGARERAMTTPATDQGEAGR